MDNPIKDFSVSIGIVALYLLPFLTNNFIPVEFIVKKYRHKGCYGKNVIIIRYYFYAARTGFYIVISQSPEYSCEKK